MDSSRPELVSKLLVEYLNAGDVDGVMGLYEEEAVFVDLDGAVTGLVDIRFAHRTFLDSGLVLTLNDSVAFVADNIALVHWSWTVHRRDGSSADGVSAEVLRRQADGSWKFIIDSSDGSAMVGTPVAGDGAGTAAP